MLTDEEFRNLCDATLKEIAAGLRNLPVESMRYRLEGNGPRSLDVFVTQKDKIRDHSNDIINFMSDIHSKVIDNVVFNFELVMPGKARFRRNVINYPLHTEQENK